MSDKKILYFLYIFFARMVMHSESRL